MMSIMCIAAPIIVAPRRRRGIICQKNKKKVKRSEPKCAENDEKERTIMMGRSYHMAYAGDAGDSSHARPLAEGVGNMVARIRRCNLRQKMVVPSRHHRSSMLERCHIAVHLQQEEVLLDHDNFRYFYHAQNPVGMILATQMRCKEGSVHAAAAVHRQLLGEPYQDEGGAAEGIENGAGEDNGCCASGLLVREGQLLPKLAKFYQHHPWKIV